MKPIKSLLLLSIILFSSCNNEAAVEQTSSVDNSMVNSYIQFWNNDSSVNLDSIISKDFKRYGNGKLEAKGQAEVKNLLKNWYTAVPDMNVTANDISIKDGKAYYYWTSKGTNTGNFGEQPPTGKSSTLNGFAVLTFDKEGKIMKEESYYDNLEIFKAWGYELVPPDLEETGSSKEE